VLIDGNVIAIGRVLLTITMPELPRLDRLPACLPAYLPTYLPTKSIGAWPMDRPTSSQLPPPIALYLLPTNHNNNI
jgi:hypothetical protein